MTPLVVGLGNPDRGDDAVGPRIARAVATAAVPGVDVVEREEPLDHLRNGGAPTWGGVADAVVSGARPRPIGVAEIARADPDAHGWTRVGLGGTHAFGLAEAVELSRALGRLPARVTLVGVEAADVTAGADLSADVKCALPLAVERVWHLLRDETAGGPHVPR